MSRELPLGRKEDFHLEFKGSEALQEPEKIAREVVAFLNADGGEVWVGLREENGRAVAVEPIADLDREASRLLDYLVETVEPVSAEEIQVEVVEAEGEKPVLLVEALPKAGRRPYAFLRRGGRHFVVRIADRIRPMSREEVFGENADPLTDELLRQAEERVRRERAGRQERREEGLWLRLEPVAAMEIDIQNRRWEEILQDPERTGNRPSGWGFGHLQHRPRLEPGLLVTPPEEDHRVEIRRTGSLTFSAPLESLNWKGDEQEIWPLILCEMPISALRTAAVVYEGVLTSADRLVTDFALIALEGWTLRAGTPGPSFATNRPHRFGSDDFLLDRPLVVSADDLFENPDAVGYRLIERVYEAFGFRREQIPQVFDRVTRRLVLPS